MKKAIIVLAIIFILPFKALATDYVLMALQPQDGGGEAPDYYHLVNGAQSHDVPVARSISLASAGSWRMVLFLLSEITPPGMTKLDAAEWLSNADGFLAFDYRMLSEYARAGVTIKNRAFDYATVLDTVLQYEWWTPDGSGGYERHTGDKADYIANGYPSKMVRVMPMPHYLGLPGDTY